METAIDVTNAQAPLDVYQDILEILVEIPTPKQLDAMDCGPTCLRMVAKHYLVVAMSASFPKPSLLW